MSIEKNNPTILIAPSRQEIQIFDPDQEDGVRIEGELGLKLDLHQYATILGVLATRGVGTYTGSEIAQASGFDSKSISGQRAKLLTTMFPEYVAYDKGFQVLQDFSIAVAPEQSDDAAIIRAKKSAASAQRRKEKLEAREQHISLLRGQLDQLIMETTYSSEDIEQLDEGKTNLYNYDSVRVTVDGLVDYVVPLIDPEDIVCARVLMELAKEDDDSELDVLSYDGKAQNIWEAMPSEERTLFANTYRKEAPRTFMKMFTDISMQLTHESAFRDPSGRARKGDQSYTTQTMRRIENVTLLSEEPTDDEHVEFAVKRYDKSNFTELRHRQWMEDKAQRKDLIAELRSMGVYVSDQIRSVQQKAKLEYAPESQIEMKAPLVELLTSILNGEIESLTQPQAMDVVYAANNARYYRAIEALGTNLQDPVSLDKAVEKLNEAAKVGLGNSYHGFATHNHMIGRATVKKLHRR